MAGSTAAATNVLPPLLATGAVIYAAGWAMTRWAHPLVPDPLLPRVLVMAALLGAATAVQVSEVARARSARILLAVEWAVTAHVFWLVWRSQMASPHIVSLLTLLGATSAVATYIHESRAQLLAWLGAIVAGSIAVVAAVGGDPFFVLGVVALAAIVWIGADTQWRHLAHLEREAEAERQLHVKLQQADKMAALGTMVAGIAHEVANPLSAVLGSLELAEGETDPESVGRALADARSAADRIARIVGDMRTYVQPGGQTLTAVELGPAVKQAVDLLVAATAHRCEVVCDVARVPPVLGNSHRLTQVVINLLRNAAQAMPDGRGRIEVRARREGNLVAIEVADDGPGVPAALRDRIFEPFFTTKPVGVGTGLGLFVCHRVMLDLGGSIELLPTPGRGATFRIVLPVAPDPRDPTSEEPAPAKGRILVVDDEPVVARALARLLREHDVETARDGREALERLRLQPFDVVLCDLMMPGMGGQELWEALHREQRGAEKRLVFLTGGASTDDARSFLDRVPNRRFLKPVDGAELRAWIALQLGARG